MKSIRLIIAALLLGSSAAVAQVNVNINFGTPPVWAPADHVEVQYYYLPEIDVNVDPRYGSAYAYDGKTIVLGVHYYTWCGCIDS